MKLLFNYSLKTKFTILLLSFLSSFFLVNSINAQTGSGSCAADIIMPNLICTDSEVPLSVLVGGKSNQSLSYQWSITSGIAFLNNDQTASPNLIAYQAGEVEVEVNILGVENCSVITANQQLTVKESPIALISIDHPEICVGYSMDIEGVHTGSGSSVSWRFTSSTGASGVFSSPNEDNTSFEATAAGDGLLTFTYTEDGTGCSTEAFRSLRIYEPLVAEASVAEEQLCIGNNTQLFGLPSGGDNNTYIHEWILEEAPLGVAIEDILDDPTSQNPILTPHADALDNQTYTLRYVLSSGIELCNNETASNPISVTLRSHPLEAELSLVGGFNTCAGEDAFLRVDVVHPGVDLAIHTYQIILNDGNEDIIYSDYISGDLIPISPNQPTTYTLVSVNDNFSCAISEDALEEESITVEPDNIAPVVICDNSIVEVLTSSDGFGDCAALIPNLKEIVRENTTDNCSAQEDLQITQEPAAGSYFGAVHGLTEEVVVTVQDGVGNTSTCIITIELIDDEKPSITQCPSDINIGTKDLQESYDCLGTATWITPQLLDNCNAQLEVDAEGVEIENNNSGQEISATFPIGSTTVTYTAADDAGNEANICSFLVLITDNEVPLVVDCPNNITVSTNSAQCEAVEHFSTPEFTDNCDTNLDIFHDAEDVLLTVTPMQSFGSFPVGTTSITFQATDDTGLTATCNFSITVEDGKAPKLVNKPNSQNIDADNGQCNSTASWNEPTVIENCEAELTVSTDNGTVITTNSLGQASGIFPLGQTVVTYTADDGFQSVQHSFLITVSDNDAPQFSNCPNDVNTSTDAGLCSAFVSFSLPQIEDNCDFTFTIETSNGTNINQSGNTGTATFPVGTTTVIYTAVDASGNSNSCSHSIEVEDIQAPSINCSSNINQSTDLGQCGAFVYLAEPQTTDACGIANISYRLNGGAAQSGNANVFIEVGTHTLTWEATDINGNTASCQTNITITDTETPTISCNDITQNTDFGQCSAYVNVPQPNSTDNCSIASITHNSPFGQSNTNASGTYPVGVTTFNWIVADINGNSSTCSISVTIQDGLAPTLANKPSSQNIDTDNGQCSGEASWIAPTVVDNCENTLTVTTDNGTTVTTNNFGMASGNFPLGQTTITYTVSDGTYSDHHSFTITVSDNETPQIISCPNNITKNTDIGLCTALITWALPQVSDNCDYSLTISTDNGVVINEMGSIGTATFPVGSTIITYQATDASGNETSCTSRVTVNDGETPAIDCVNELTLNTDLGLCGANVSIPLPTTSDNCGVMSTTYRINDGNPQSGNPSSYYTTGITTITWEVNDVNGNSNVCQTTLEIIDNELPVIQCVDIIQNNDAGQCGAEINVPQPQATDNCSILSITHNGDNGNSINASGYYEVGTTSLVWTILDANGNSSSCTMNITVEDNESPQIANCNQIPIQILTTSSNGSGDCSATIPSLSHLVEATDNCGLNIQQLTPVGTPFSGQHGTDMFVTIQATDTDGLTASCDITVRLYDDETPQVNACPNNITVTALNNECFGEATWMAPNFSDNCAADLIIETNAVDFGATSGNGQQTGYFPIGTHDVHYTAKDAGNNAISCLFTVEVIQPDFWNPDFSFDGFLQEVQFTNESTGDYHWFWDFGDGSVSILENPTHTYLLPGTYTVTLSINNCGNVFIQKEVSVPMLGLDDPDGSRNFVNNENSKDEEWKVFPNPAQEELNLQLPKRLMGETVQIELYNIQGQLVLSRKVSNDFENLQIDLADIQNGNHLLRVIYKDEVLTDIIQVIKE